jgi:hypothetical protein
MSKDRSRVAQEAREAQQRAAEVQKKIRDLSTQLSDPQKHFAPKPNEKTQSTVERFRRYFNLDATSDRIEKRKATRAEMRAQRNQAIVWTLVALFVIAWMIGGGCQAINQLLPE